MRLRKTIKKPARLDEDVVFCEQPRTPTTPAFPSLLASTVIDFKPDHPPAAFPSLPFLFNSPPKAKKDLVDSQVCAAEQRRPSVLRLKLNGPATAVLGAISLDISAQMMHLDPFVREGRQARHQSRQGQVEPYLRDTFASQDYVSANEVG
jgi:hypothetical protein